MKKEDIRIQQEYHGGRKTVRPRVGDIVRVRSDEGLPHILEVEVTDLNGPEMFTGVVLHVFGDGGGPVTSGDVLVMLGQEKPFKTCDIVF